MSETLSIRPTVGTEAWIERDDVDTLMDQGWQFKVKGYDDEFCKIEIVGKAGTILDRTRTVEVEEEEPEEEPAFEPFLCDYCGSEYGPEDYETRAAAQAALAGHTNIHREEESNNTEEEAGLDVLFPEEEEEEASV